MANKVYVVGVGMTKFEKPGRRENWDYPQMAGSPAPRPSRTPASATTQVEQAYVGYVYGESTSGQRAVYELGMTGIPVVNVNNNCSTGSTALYLAAQAIRGGLADCALALGFEKMQPGSLGVDVRRPRAADDAATCRRSPRSPRCCSRPRRGCSAPPAAST